MTNLVKEAVEVNVDTFPSERVKEDVFSMAIAKSQDVADHGHHSSGAAVCRAAAVPGHEHVQTLEKNPPPEIKSEHTYYISI